MKDTERFGRRAGMAAATCAATILAIWLVGQEAAMAAGDNRVFGWVEVTPVPGHADRITIRPHAVAMQAAAGTFRLRVSRMSRGSKTDNSQTGKFSLAAGESRALSSTTINIQSQDKLEFELKLLDGDKDAFVVILRTP